MGVTMVHLAETSFAVHRTLAEVFSLADAALWGRTLMMRDYNTRVVVFAVAVLGMAAGIVGTWTLLRRRALVGDAISHATLPGIAAAFLIVQWLDASGASSGLSSRVVPLTIGAVVAGLLSVGTLVVLRRTTRLKEDAALGIVLSGYFGLGVALQGIVQQVHGSSAAGLESYIFGKTASMTIGDVRMIGWTCVATLAVTLLLRREWTLLCFDEPFCGSRGYPTLFLDVALMTCVIAVAIVGLQAVGLILVIALLVIPPAAARFWTDRLGVMAILAGVVGAVGGIAGALVSAVYPKLPSGALIVLACATLFGFSLLLGTKRGLVGRWINQWRLRRSVAHQHLLRAMFEAQEGVAEDVVTRDELTAARSWSAKQLSRTIDRAASDGWVVHRENGVQLTRRGWVEAERLTRQHRLWELYLMHYADVAPSRVDRQADRIEHVLQPETIAELRAMLNEADSPMPPNPHAEPGSSGPAVAKVVSDSTSEATR